MSQRHPSQADTRSARQGSMIDELKELEVLRGRRVSQIGIVVGDLGSALRRYSRIWALGPWHCYTYSPETVPTLTYRGAPGRFAMKLALNGESPQIELVEPIEGPSLYHEWLERHGEGLHHIGVIVDALGPATVEMQAAGYGVLQSGLGYGLDGDGGFAYFDTEALLGVILELIEVPVRRRLPERVFDSAGQDSPDTSMAHSGSTTRKEGL